MATWAVARPRLDLLFDFVRDMRNDLDRAAEIIAAPLLLDHALVNLAGGEIIAPAHLPADEALVMPEVEVGFRAVFGNKYFTMLKWTHGAGIHVDVGIQLEQGNLDAARFENSCERGRRDAFPQGRDYTTRHKYILCHGRV